MITEKKYLEYHAKLLLIIDSCTMPEHIDAVVTMCTRFNDMYPNVKGDILVNRVCRRLEEVMKGYKKYVKKS